MKSLHNSSQIRPFLLVALTLTSIIGFFAIQLPNPRKIAHILTSSLFSTNLTVLEGNHSGSCWDQPWPDLDLFLTIPPDGIGEREYRDIFLPSLALFWPRRHTKLLIATDAEDPNSPQFSKWALTLTREATGMDARTVFVPRAFPCQGWHKSQWLKFWADNFTKSEYVGYVDSDTLFISRVALTDLFVEGRPIVRPIYGKPKTADINYWSRTPQKTFQYTGHKEPFNCMSYFPVIVKTAHLRFFRDRILERVLPGRTFDEAFSLIVNSNFYSEYNIMCTIMWYNFRDQYFWVINESDPGWSGNVLGQIANFAEGNITMEDLKPRPHVCIHPFHSETAFPGITEAMRQGVCFSMADSEQRPPYCRRFWNRSLTVNSLEFQFETDDFSWRPGAFAAHLRRIEENDKCPHEWPLDRLKLLDEQFGFAMW